MIQDIEPCHLDNAYVPVPPDGDSFILYYEDRHVLLRHTDRGIGFPTFEETVDERSDACGEYIYLFAIDDRRYYLTENIDQDRLGRYEMESIEIFRRADPQYHAFAGITGYHLYNWYRDHRYCGRCASPMEHDGKERMLTCTKCGNVEFPKICPAVIVGVVDGDRILMSKYSGRTYKKYALIAGFTEIGETVEDTVRREVMEEVGLKVRNIRYYKSQPWGFSDTILMGFYCDLDGGDEITLDREELELAQWFKREEISVEPSRDSLTNEMIMRFKNKEI